MANYFESNRPAVVGVPVSAEALANAFGLHVTREVEIPFRTDDLAVKTGEESGDADDLHWVEYRVPGTEHMKRVERRMPKGWDPTPNGLSPGALPKTGGPFRGG